MSITEEEAVTTDARTARSDVWFRAEVKRALGEADRNERGLIDHRSVMTTVRSRFGFSPVD